MKHAELNRVFHLVVVSLEPLVSCPLCWGHMPSQASLNLYRFLPLDFWKSLSEERWVCWLLQDCSNDISCCVTTVKWYCLWDLMLIWTFFQLSCLLSSFFFKDKVKLCEGRQSCRKEMRTQGLSFMKWTLQYFLTSMFLTVFRIPEAQKVTTSQGYFCFECILTQCSSSVLLRH